MVQVGCCSAASPHLCAAAAAAAAGCEAATTLLSHCKLALGRGLAADHKQNTRAVVRAGWGGGQLRLADAQAGLGQVLRSARMVDPLAALRAPEALMAAVMGAWVWVERELRVWGGATCASKQPSEPASKKSIHPDSRPNQLAINQPAIPATQASQPATQPTSQPAPTT